MAKKNTAVRSWILCGLLTVAAIVIWRWPSRPPGIELLPFSDSPPSWDGSYPYLVLTAPPDSPRVKFVSAIKLIRPTMRHDAPVNEFEVDLHTGRFVLRQTDLFVADAMPLSLTRTYIAWDYHSRAFGVGSNHPYDIAVTGDRFPYTYMNLNLEGGEQIFMARASKGTRYADAAFRHIDTASEFYGAMVQWNGNGWTLTFRDGRRVYFPDSYQAKTYAQGAPIEMDDAQGHRLLLKRSPTRNLIQLISPAGHTLRFQYDSSDRIIEAADDAGRLRKYSYDSSGHVQTVSVERRVLYRFEYSRLMADPGYDPYLLTAVMDGDWKVLLQNRYSLGRVVEQRLGDGQIYHYDYALRGRDVIATTVTFPTGGKKIFGFRDGRLIESQ
jgi:YD repeat-containing protein